MKRNHLMLVAVFIFSSTVFSQTEQISKKDQFSHWSAGFGAGLNYYRVLPSGTSYFDNIGTTTPYLFLDYTINPLFGTGIELSFNNYDRGGITAKGNTTDLMFSASINMSNVLVPERTGFWKKVSFYTNAGAGIGLYHFDLTSPVVSYTSISPFVNYGLNAEIKLSKSLALSLQGQYRSYIRENMGGISTAQIDNDALFGTIGFRFNFGSKKKAHVRNITVNEYNPELNQLKTKVEAYNDQIEKSKQLAEQLKEDNNTLKKQLNTVQQESKKCMSSKQSGLFVSKFKGHFLILQI